MPETSIRIHPQDTKNYATMYATDTELRLSIGNDNGSHAVRLTASEARHLAGILNVAAATLENV